PPTPLSLHDALPIWYWRPPTPPTVQPGHAQAHPPPIKGGASTRLPRGRRYRAPGKGTLPALCQFRADRGRACPERPTTRASPSRPTAPHWEQTTWQASRDCALATPRIAVTCRGSNRSLRRKRLAIAHEERRLRQRREERPLLAEPDRRPPGVADLREAVPVDDHGHRQVGGAVVDLERRQVDGRVLAREH